MESTTISARINTKTLKELEKLSKATKRSKKPIMVILQVMKKFPNIIKNGN
jgi:hypothetical protein